MGTIVDTFKQFNIKNTCMDIYDNIKVYDESTLND